ncbi:MAG: type VI secretion system ATPase TssH [Betaproteobacteria bacterium]|nr:type VI secretion system ATPase TssH [Betaproteobacteria bacterium]
MLLVDLKPLVSRLNPYCRNALEGAAGLCLSRTNYEITVEHLLSKLLEDLQSDVPLILRQNGVDVGQFKRAIDQAIDDFRTGNAAKPTFSPLLPELLQDAWLISSVNHYDRQIRSGALFLAFLARATFYATGGYADLVRALKRETVQEKFGEATRGSLEATAEGGRAPEGGAPPGAGEGGALARFCENFTEKARGGKIDPVFGRDLEIRQMVDILARRRKNNPICVGEPGVGKTAVVEGLALRVVQGDVPKSLQGVTILGLDMGLLEAGAGVKGEFENRLKGVINEIKASPKPIILFIDEAHTLIGAGGAAGGGDAANLLKPALARGELRTIAATTWAEYKKYFEKDAALARRFQLVKLDEPTVDTSVMILRGLKDKYEEVHKVIVRDDAVVAAAEMSSRYITGRQLPDKAVDLLDTSAARVKVSLSSKPDVVEDRERRIQALEREKRALERDRENGRPVDEERLVEIDQEVTRLNGELATLTARWEKERAAAEKLVELRKRRADAMTAGKPEKGVESIKADIAAAEQALAAIQGDAPLIRIEVDPDVVAKVVSDWTGIPLGKVLRDQAQSVLHMEEVLRQRLKGQDHALEIIAEILRSAKAGLKDPNQPMGVFLLVGPSGVGKTETALSVADILFGGEQSAVIINMSEYQEKHTVSRLVGSPPGYVGYGEGGVLTEAVRQRPYSAVLLDEVEKAHLDVMNLFYQVFDKGTLADGEGREIDFKNTVLFLTSNLATDVITELCGNKERPPLEAVMNAVRPILSNHFKPALLARMTVVPYYTLPQDALKGIVELKLGKVAARLSESNRVKLNYTPKVLEQIAQRCTEVETGARNIDFILRGAVLPMMSQEILHRMGSGAMPSAVNLDVGDDGGFKIGFSD